MNNEPQDLTNTRQMEQAETGVESTARLQALYYKTLIENGVPEDPATGMAMQWLDLVFMNNQGMTGGMGG